MPYIPIPEAWKLTGGMGRIEGAVCDADSGLPIAGATVLIRPGRGRRMPKDPEDRGWRSFFMTGPDRTFHLEAVPEGRFEVEASSPSYLSHAQSWLREFHGTGERGESLFDLFGRTAWRGADESLIEKFGDHEVARNHYPRVTESGVVRISLRVRFGQLAWSSIKTTQTTFMHPSSQGSELLVCLNLVTYNRGRRSRARRTRGRGDTR